MALIYVNVRATTNNKNLSPRRNLAFFPLKKSQMDDGINIRKRPLRSPRRFAPGLASLGIRTCFFKKTTAQYLPLWD